MEHRGNIEIGVFGLLSSEDILEKVFSPDPISKDVIDGSYTTDTINTVPLTPTDKEQIESAIQKNTNNINLLKEEKVDKEVGYALSKNDFSDFYKNKLDNVEDYANVNVIESISVNGIEKSIVGKNVDISIPTKTSEISNDTDFTTNEHVENVKNYLSEKINTNNEKIKENKDSIDNIKTSLNNYSLVGETGNVIELVMDSSTYKIKAILKDKNGSIINNSNEIDLPMESLVLSVSYNGVDKELVITLQNGTITRIPLSSLISGLVSENTLDFMLSNYVLKSNYNMAISNLETSKADKSSIYTKEEVNQLLIDGNYNFATFELDLPTGELIMRKTDDMLLQFNLNNDGFLEVII